MDNISKDKKWLIVPIIMIAMLFLLIGCGSDQSVDEKKNDAATEKPSPTLEAEEEKEIKTIGNVYAVELKNNTGKDIIGISVKAGEAEAFPENLMAQDDIFASDEERLLYCVRTEEDMAIEKQIKGEQAATGTAVPSENAAGENSEIKLLTISYDVQIAFADGTVNVLHAFPFGDVKHAELILEDGVLFIVYTSVSTQETVSTKEAETAIKEMEQAAAEQAAEQAAAEQAAAEQAAAERAAAEQAAAEQAAAEQAAAEQAAAEQAAAKQAAAEQAAAEQAAAEQAAEQDSESCIGDDGLTY